MLVYKHFKENLIERWLFCMSVTPVPGLQCPLHLDLYSSLPGRWGSATSLCCSSPSILVAEQRLSWVLELRRAEPESGSSMFSSLEVPQLGDICAGFILQIFEVCGSNWSLFPWGEPKEKELLFSVNAYLSTFHGKVSIAFGKLSLVWAWTLASQEKVVKLPVEWNRPISWVSRH